MYVTLNTACYIVLYPLKPYYAFTNRRKEKEGEKKEEKNVIENMAETKIATETGREERKMRYDLIWVFQHFVSLTRIMSKYQPEIARCFLR